MLDNLRQDFCRINYYNTKQPEQIGLGRIVFEAMRNAGFRAVVFYRMGRWFRLHKMGFAAAVIERMMHHLCHCWISTLGEIGPGLSIPHVCGITVLLKAGRNCTIRQNVTIGGNYASINKASGFTNPCFGDNVSVGPGASVLGPITIGSNTFIGANSVVTKDIPEKSVVVASKYTIIMPDGSIVREGSDMFVSKRDLSAKIKSLEEKIKKLDQLIQR